MNSLYDYQKQCVAQLLAGKKIVYAGMGLGKNPISMVWAGKKCEQTGKRKILVVTTASKAKTCFVAGTKVLTPSGEKNIEDISVGEKVLSYRNGNVCLGKVVDTIKQKTDKALYRIDFGGCCNIIGTEDHPFYIGNGEYKEMKELRKGDVIYGIYEKNSRGAKKAQRGDVEVLQGKPQSSLLSMSKTNTRTDESSARPMVEEGHANLLERVRFIGEEDEQEKSLQKEDGNITPQRSAMLDVRRTNNLRGNGAQPKNDLLQDRENILLYGVRKESSNISFVESEKEHDSCAKNRTGEDKSKSFRRKEHPHERKTISNTKPRRRGAGICSRLRGYLCPDRCGLPRKEDRDRDRRVSSWKSKTTEGRYTKGREVVPIRVENIQILRKGISGENIVYCVEIEGAHNFFANGVLVHNCDHANDLASFYSPLPNSLSSLSLSVISWHKLARWAQEHWAEAKDYVFVFDEIQRCGAGVSSGMGRAFLKLTGATPNWAGFTGTPGDTWLKFYPYMQACGLVRNKTTFLRTYATIQTYKGYPEIVEWRNEDKLQRMWAQISYAPDTQKAIQELPKSVNRPIAFSLPKTYYTVLKTRYNADGEFLDTAGALTAELRRICFTKDKQEWMKDFVQDVDRGAVIFYNYVATGDALEEIIAKALSKEGKIWRIDGKHHDIPTAGTIGKKDMVLCQWQSGSEALNLQMLNYMVMVELPYSYSTLKQGMGRIRRLGQTQTMFFYTLLCEKGIEQDVRKILSAKGVFASSNWCASKGVSFSG